MPSHKLDAEILREQRAEILDALRTAMNVIEGREPQSIATMAFLRRVLKRYENVKT